MECVARSSAFFFFQAEDGIRDGTVTGVQTCALPIYPQVRYAGTLGGNVANGDPGNDMPAVMMCLNATYQIAGKRSEERRVGKEWRPLGWGCLLRWWRTTVSARLTATAVTRDCACPWM